jgi:hypothetical protein
MTLARLRVRLGRPAVAPAAPGCERNLFPEPVAGQPAKVVPEGSQAGGHADRPAAGGGAQRLSYHPAALVPTRAPEARVVTGLGAVAAAVGVAVVFLVVAARLAMRPLVAAVIATAAGARVRTGAGARAGAGSRASATAAEAAGRAEHAALCHA